METDLDIDVDLNVDIDVEVNVDEDEDSVADVDVAVDVDANLKKDLPLLTNTMKGVPFKLKTASFAADIIIWSSYMITM